MPPPPPLFTVLDTGLEGALLGCGGAGGCAGMTGGTTGIGGGLGGVSFTVQVLFDSCVFMSGVYHYNETAATSAAVSYPG